MNKYFENALLILYLNSYFKSHEKENQISTSGSKSVKENL